MSEPLLFALSISLAHTLTFLAVWGGFSWMFRRGVLRRHQIAGGKSPDGQLSRTARRELVFAHLGFPFAVYAAVYPLWTAAGGRMDAGWPAWWVVLLHLAAFIAVQDTIFYWSHRLLHTRWLFSHVHYKHHRFRIVRGEVAEFAHPLESLFNFVAMFAGPVLLGSPLPVLLLWMVIRIAETVEAHSGYALTPVSSRHAFHHLHAQRGCYGSFMSPWDYVMGTDRLWREQRAQERAKAREAAA